MYLCKHPSLLHLILCNNLETYRCFCDPTRFLYKGQCINVPRYRGMFIQSPGQVTAIHPLFAGVNWSLLSCFYQNNPLKYFQQAMH